MDYSRKAFQYRLTPPRSLASSLSPLASSTSAYQHQPHHKPPAATYQQRIRTASMGTARDGRVFGGCGGSSIRASGRDEVEVMELPRNSSSSSSSSRCAATHRRGRRSRLLSPEPCWETIGEEAPRKTDEEEEVLTGVADGTGHEIARMVGIVTSPMLGGESITTDRSIHHNDRPSDRGRLEALLEMQRQTAEASKIRHTGQLISCDETQQQRDDIHANKVAMKELHEEKEEKTQPRAQLVRAIELLQAVIVRSVEALGRRASIRLLNTYFTSWRMQRHHLLTSSRQNTSCSGDRDGKSLPIMAKDGDDKKGSGRKETRTKEKHHQRDSNNKLEKSKKKNSAAGRDPLPPSTEGRQRQRAAQYQHSQQQQQEQARGIGIESSGGGSPARSYREVGRRSRNTRMMKINKSSVEGDSVLAPGITGGRDSVKTPSL